MFLQQQLCERFWPDEQESLEHHHLNVSTPTSYIRNAFWGGGVEETIRRVTYMHEPIVRATTVFESLPRVTRPINPVRAELAPNFGRDGGDLHSWNLVSMRTQVVRQDLEPSRTPTRLLEATGRGLVCGVFISFELFILWFSGGNIYRGEGNCIPGVCACVLLPFVSFARRTDKK